MRFHRKMKPLIGPTAGPDFRPDAYREALTSFRHGSAEAEESTRKLFQCIGEEYECQLYIIAREFTKNAAAAKLERLFFAQQCRGIERQSALRWNPRRQQPQ